MTTQRVYGMGPRIEKPGHHYALLQHVLERRPSGVALEFGVGAGQSTRLIAEYMPVIGFDSFQGLPEDWREEYPKGSFACEKPIIGGVWFVVGLFAETLPDVLGNWFPPIGLVHIDCDLYSSTATVFRHIGDKLTPGTYVVFDEFHGYEGCEEHEQRAWRELVQRNGIEWTVIGHGFEQWAIQITRNGNLQ